MTKLIRWGCLAAISVAALMGITGCGGGRPPPALDDPTAAARDQQAFVEAMSPRRAGRPVIAILALNEGTEMTDFLLTHAVLRRADVADVIPVAPRAGTVTLYPALAIDGARSLDEFDRTHPDGPDVVIVPAMRVDDDPRITGWLRRQAERGARVIGVCSGVRVLGRAGLLDGRRFTGHWYDRSTLLERHPAAIHVPHRRYLADRGVATTTGITASIPVSLALVEAIGGRERARSVAEAIGAAGWAPVHDSGPFHLDTSRRFAFLLEKAAFWRHEHWQASVADGIDDIALALAADAWSRTGRVAVDAVTPDGQPIRMMSGLTLATRSPVEGRGTLVLADSVLPVRQLDRALCDIEARFGRARRDWVMLEMEYPGSPGPCPGDMHDRGARR